MTTPITQDGIAALYAKQGTPTFYVVVNDGGKATHFTTPALNVESLYAQLVVLLANLGITEFWILDAGATVLLRDANLNGVMASLDAPLKHRIEQLKLAIEAVKQGKG